MVHISIYISTQWDNQNQLSLTQLLAAALIHMENTPSYCSALAKPRQQRTRLASTTGLARVCGAKEWARWGLRMLGVERVGVFLALGKEAEWIKRGQRDKELFVWKGKKYTRRKYRMLVLRSGVCYTLLYCVLWHFDSCWGRSVEHLKVPLIHCPKLSVCLRTTKQQPSPSIKLATISPSLYMAKKWCR